MQCLLISVFYLLFIFFFLYISLFAQRFLLISAWQSLSIFFSLATLINFPPLGIFQIVSASISLRVDYSLVKLISLVSFPPSTFASVLNNLYLLYDLGKYLVNSFFAYNDKACAVQPNLVAENGKPPRTPQKKYLKKYLKNVDLLEQMREMIFMIDKMIKICEKRFILEITTRIGKMY